MKIIVLIIVILIAESFGGDEDKSVHFKIHVPDIVKHHIHTKTVFIHVYEMKPHDEEEDKEEHHVEDWTSYNSYNYKGGVEENHGGGYHRKKQKKVIAPLVDDYMPIREDDYQSYGAPYSDELSDNLLNNEPPAQDNPLGFFGPSMDPEELMDPRAPPASTYEIYEDVEEEKPNDVEHVYHEQGYRHGMKSETGHVIHKDLKDFYDKENQQAEFNKGGYQDDSYNKYDKYGYLGNYDKEMNAEQRSGKKKRADKRFFVRKMIIR